MGPFDTTYILEREDPTLFPTVTKSDYQQADGSPVHTKLWSFFCKQSFLNFFSTKREGEIAWKPNDGNPYRRHPWRRRVGMPEGWEGALNGFRVFALRWWRRNLLRTYLSWETRRYPTTANPRTHLIGWRRPPGGKRPHYMWSTRGRGGKAAYLAQVRDSCMSKKRSREVAADALRRAVGPYTRGHPDFLAGWWD